MRIRQQFCTQKEAVAYLEKRDWKRTGESLGDWKFTHVAHAHCNLVVQMQNGMWEIHAYGATVA